ncbi:MAG: hypothetical protein Edafosvirus12_30 [Edafosvirus sp.]|uniref:Uncharacterized protein n=1 Tax=Edafosvirus sp. TaxID=2487765 RepID=A0A3G4ZWR0_9VIRU|nr:MAG: hypothetical protein Edafosvirus12_30 [Edafosvirus sp.]
MENLGNVFNITNVDKSSVSLSRALLIFYILIASSFTGGLYSKQLKQYFEESRCAQHLIGFIMMLVVIVIIGGVNDIKPALIYTLIAYVWFILTTKLDLQWNVIIILLMLFGFMYENQMIYKETNSKDDPALTEKEREKIKEQHNKNKTYIVLSIITVTLIGTFLYAEKKTVQYGGNFDAMTYLFK